MDILDKITFHADYINNGDVDCWSCMYCDRGDYSVGLYDSCFAPILYDKNDDLIEEFNDLIIESMNNPRQCKFYQKKKVKSTDEV